MSPGPGPNETDPNGPNPRASDRVAGVLFDATGTLFETRESIGEVYARRAAPHGVKLPAWRLDDAFARILAGAPPRVFPDCEVAQIAELEQDWWRAVVRSSFLAADSTVKFDDFSTFFADLYAYYATADAWSLRPGTRDLLRGLKQREYRTGVVSNFDQRLSVILQALEIDEFLDLVMIPAQCRSEKPDARIFVAALEQLQLPARAVVYVGDDPEKDRAAAERVGMQCLDPESFGSFTDLLAQVEQMSVRQGESEGRN